MPRVHKTLLVPGEQVTAANEQLQGDGDQTADANGSLVVFEQRFNDNCIMTISVVAGEPPRLIAELYDQNDAMLATEQCAGDVAQDYTLGHGDNTYEVSLVRAASTVLTPDAIEAYNNNPSHCPACGATEIHTSPPQIGDKEITVRATCCACNARWKDVYDFTTVSRSPADWSPPSQNVARQAP